MLESIFSFASRYFTAEMVGLELLTLGRRIPTWSFSKAFQRIDWQRKQIDGKPVNEIRKALLDYSALPFWRRLSVGGILQGWRLRQQRQLLNYYSTYQIFHKAPSLLGLPPTSMLMSTDKNTRQNISSRPPQISAPSAFQLFWLKVNGKGKTNEFQILSIRRQIASNCEKMKVRLYDFICSKESSLLSLKRFNSSFETWIMEQKMLINPLLEKLDHIKPQSDQEESRRIQAKNLQDEFQENIKRLQSLFNTLFNHCHKEEQLGQDNLTKCYCEQIQKTHQNNQALTVQPQEAIGVTEKGFLPKHALGRQWNADRHYLKELIRGYCLKLVMKAREREGSDSLLEEDSPFECPNYLTLVNNLTAIVKRLSVSYHPDKWDSEEDKRIAALYFQALHHLKETLKTQLDLACEHPLMYIKQFELEQLRPLEDWEAVKSCWIETLLTYLEREAYTAEEQEVANLKRRVIQQWKGGDKEEKAEEITKRLKQFWHQELNQCDIKWRKYSPKFVRELDPQQDKERYRVLREEEKIQLEIDVKDEKLRTKLLMLEHIAGKLPRKFAWYGGRPLVNRLKRKWFELGSAVAKQRQAEGDNFVNEVLTLGNQDYDKAYWALRHEWAPLLRKYLPDFAEEIERNKRDIVETYAPGVKHNRY